MTPITAAQLRAKSWWLPLCRYHYGLGPRPADAPKMVKPQYQAAFDEWAKFDKWNPWVASGRHPPRPAGVWSTVPQWAWTIRKELAQAHHPPPPPPGPPGFPTVPSKTKGRNGVYFYVYQNAEIGEAKVIELCKRYNLWVALLVHELDRAPIPSFDTFAQRDRLKNAGLTVVASGWADSAYDLDAQAQAAAHWSQGFDEYILNAEASWAYVPGTDTSGFTAMGSFAPKLRAALGAKMPLSLSCMWGQVTWLRPLLQAGMSVIRPQCYLNQYGHMTPAGAIERLAWAQNDLPQGTITPDMVEATYGKYGGFMQPLATWTDQDNAAVRMGMKARSDWAAEFNSEADYAWLGSR